VGDIDRRTDLWGLGATMFALLSGHLVHAAATAAETTSLAATRPARALGEVGPHVPGALRDVVDRALAFDRNDRWQDARAMRQALVLACTSALGCPPTALAPLVGAPRDAEEGADGPPTQGRDASRSPAPGAPFDGAMSSPLASQPPTTTGPTSRRHVPVARDQRGRDRLRMPGIVALAIGGAVLVGLAMGGRSAPTGVIAPAASAPLVRPQEATMPAPSPETGTAPPPPVSASAAARAPAATAVPRPSLPPASPRKPPAPAPPPSSSSPKPSCDPPYTIDAAGHHIYKAECD
jgi:serine/threonine-protein kinase